jgi:hypothetical protein
MQVAIASKGRVAAQPALRMFMEYKIPVTFFVEPGELEAYKSSWGEVSEIVDIGKSNAGLGFVRNFILNYMHGLFWMVDDDVSEITKRIEGKLVKGNTYNFMSEMENILSYKNLAQLGISFMPSNWLCKESLRYFYRAWAIKLINADKIKERGLHFVEDKGLSLFEDYIFTLDISLNGLSTATTFNYAFDTVAKMGSNEGGCQTYRTPELSKESALILQKMYGKDLVEVKYIAKHKQYEAQIKWANLKRRVLGL